MKTYEPSLLPRNSRNLLLAALLLLGSAASSCSCERQVAGQGQPCDDSTPCAMGLTCQSGQCLPGTPGDNLDGSIPDGSVSPGTDGGNGEDAGPPCHWGDPCADPNVECGIVADGCGGVKNCGGCTYPQSCGGGNAGANKCGGTKGCKPLTCADLKLNCGPAGDGCGGTLDCGGCQPTERCGGGGVPGQCGGTYDPGTGNGVCTPKTCAQQGFDCGSAGDTCGGTITSCGDCPAFDPAHPTANDEICGGGNQPNVCGGWADQGLDPYCTNLCLNQVKNCPGGATTTITGRVVAATNSAKGFGNPDPIYDALVYVPNKPEDIKPFTPGVSCDQCLTAEGSPLISAHTDYMGQFTLTNVPVGVDFNLVVQLGRWRRQVKISSIVGAGGIPACTTKAVGDVRLPRNKSEGDIPLMAVSTGNADSLECILRKMGIDDSEFTSSSGNGRVRLYQGCRQYSPASKCGQSISGISLDTALYGSATELAKYDMVLFDCVGSEVTKSADQIQNVIDYAAKGGRVFASHFGYVWFFQPGTTDSWTGTANWNSKAGSGSGSPAYIDMSFKKGGAFANWLNAITGSTLGQVTIFDVKGDTCGVNFPTQSWINAGSTPSACSGPNPLHLTFNTPVGATNQCGRAIFDGFHVIGSASGNFPSGCSDTPLTAQEKILEFTLFDLASCVEPDGPISPRCTPKTCAQQGFDCGTAGDGCGGTVDCRACPNGGVCGAGGPNKCGACTKTTCAAQGLQCGPGSDGCGGLLDCGSCVATGQTCGGGGVPGKCGTPECATRLTCQGQGIECGAAGDGCGGTLSCGTCPQGQTCGAVEKGKCGTVSGPN